MNSSSSPLQEAFLRLQRLFPSCLTGLSSLPAPSWRNDAPAVNLLEEAMSRCKWAALDERYSARLKELRKEAASQFENYSDTVRLQCRAFHEAMDELDRARREAVNRVTRRQMGG
jgi:hypothetical protein